MPEILAPCGSPETLEAALRCGCDAVYLGGAAFSARQNARNFSDEELKAAVYECHKRGVKVYQAINTIVFDEQLEECKAAVRFAAKIGIDGLITQDLVLCEIVKKCCPHMEIHASTQMTVHTVNGVKAAEELGFSRVVLSRELPLEKLAELSALGVETEAFVHGALCMSVSGQCYMSAVIGSRSANRGLCAQACRLPCSAVRGKERYDLSLKDMSYLDRIKDIEKAGVYSFKIEGRMKRPEYAAMATDSLKKALNGEDYDKQTLADVFSRGGFTDGYLMGKRGAQMFGVRSSENAAAASKAFPKIHELYRHEGKRDTVTFRLEIKKDRPVVLKAEDSVGVTAETTGTVPEQAASRSIGFSSAESKLSKLGDTIYNYGGLETDIDDGLYVSPSELNRLRREVCEKLDMARAESNTHRAEFCDCELLDICEYRSGGRPAIRICVSNLEQLKAVALDKAELCAVPLELCTEAARIFPTEKLIAAMPRFTFDEKAQIRELEKAKASGIKGLLASNIAHIKIAKDMGMSLHLDYGLNISNSCALQKACELGAEDAVLSFELKASQIGKIKKSIPTGVFAYGRIPLMLTVNCPISQAVGCGKCTGVLIDRTNREFMIKCPKRQKLKTRDYVEVMNSEVLFIADRLDNFSNVDFLTLNFFDEDPEQVRKIIGAYRRENDYKPQTVTGGLYFRGVK